MNKLFSLLKKNWLIVLILVLSLFLRVYRINDYMEFLGDQGRDVTIIREFLKKGDLIFIGPQTSIGNMYLGPYFYYLIAPALLIFNFSPIGPAVFIALLSVLTTWLIYFVSNKWFNKRAAFISSFLFAISPVVIKYSNFIWNPNIMPLFVLLFVYFFFEAVESNKVKYFIYTSISFVMIFNSHYLGLSILPFIGIFWIIAAYGFLKKNKKDLYSFIFNTFIALVVFFISLTPLVLFDLKHNGQNGRALLKFFVERETTVSIKPYKAIPQMWPLFNQVNTRLLASKNIQFGLLVSVLFIIGLVYVYKVSNKKERKYLNIVTVWYAIGLMCLALYKNHIYDHYFAFLFPVVFILFGYILSKNKKVMYLFLLPLIYFAIIENPLRWNPPKQLDTDKKIADSIIQNSNNSDFNFALLAKMNYDPPYKYILTQKTSKMLKLDEKITDQLFVVCEPFQIECNPINNSEWAIAAFGWSKIDSQWEINGIKVFKLVHTVSEQKKN